MDDEKCQKGSRQRFNSRFREMIYYLFMTSIIQQDFDIIIPMEKFIVSLRLERNFHDRNLLRINSHGDDVDDYNH